jgi:hypothetical protein
MVIDGQCLKDEEISRGTALGILTFILAVETTVSLGYKTYNQKRQGCSEETKPACNGKKVASKTRESRRQLTARGPEVAQLMLSIRFWRASERGMDRGSWEPAAGKPEHLSR